MHLQYRIEGHPKLVELLEVYRMKAQQRLPNGSGKRGADLTAGPRIANEERRWVAAAKKGDARAFEILCTQPASMVFNIARRIMRTKEDAEDVVQESFQLAFIHLKHFKGESRFSTWLIRIVTNAALMRLRRTNARRELSLEQVSEFQPSCSLLDIKDQSLDPEQLYVQEERHWSLRRAINKLSPEVRRAVEMRELDGQSTEETARMMGISVGAVKSRIFHARRKLRRLLNPTGTEPMRGGEKRRMGTLASQTAYNAGD